MSGKSKWVEIRDSIVDALKVEEIGTTVKDRFVGWVEDEGVDFIQTFADSISTECRKAAATESGWCKIRDSIVIPGLLNAGMFFLKMVIDRSKTVTQ